MVIGRCIIVLLIVVLSIGHCSQISVTCTLLPPHLHGSRCPWCVVGESSLVHLWKVLQTPVALLVCVSSRTQAAHWHLRACPGETVIAFQHWKPLLVRLEMYLDNEVGDQRLSGGFGVEVSVAKLFSNIRQKLTS